MFFVSDKQATVLENQRPLVQMAVRDLRIPGRELRVVSLSKDFFNSKSILS